MVEDEVEQDEEQNQNDGGQGDLDGFGDEQVAPKGFIKESGRSELPGRPILYETTNEFLDYFGLSSTEELPNIEEIINESEESDESTDLYSSKYIEDEI